MTKILLSLREEIESLISAAIEKSKAKESEERRSGKILTNNPLAQMLIPLRPADFDAPPELPKGTLLMETPKVYDGVETTAMRLVSGETRFLESRRQWGAYAPVHELLRNENVPENLRWETIHEFFLFSYGVMAICRRWDENGDSFLLMGVRSAKLGTLNVGKISFPAGMIRPQETLELGLYRELQEETGLMKVLWRQDYAIHRFVNACSMTFSRLGEIQKDQPIQPSYEVEGKTFIWVPEAALRQALFDNNSSALVESFRSQDIPVSADVKVTEDGAETYCQLSRLYPV